MNTFKKITAVVLIFFIWIWITFAYNPVDKDLEIAYKIEDKLYNKIDNNDNITASFMVDALIWLQESRKMSERVNYIITIIIEDLIYDYDLENQYELVYEMLPEDCYEWEQYDEIEKECYVEYYEDEDLVDEYYDENFDWEHHWENTNENIEATYKINGNEIKLLEWDIKNEHMQMWELFTTIIPKNYRWDFAEYSISNNPNGDTFAHVEQNINDNTKWNISLNRAAFYTQEWELNKKESIYTLIHEFAHVLTLNKSQVKYFPIDASESVILKFQWKCNTNFIMEGCLHKNSYLETFINSYWKDNFKKIQNSSQEEEFDFYTWNESEFVTDYAATNPWEDIAETFTMFVLKIKPTWNTISEQKILQLYNYPELIKLREIIKSRLEKIK